MKRLISRLTMRKDRLLSLMNQNGYSYYKDCYGVLWVAKSRFGKREQVWHIGPSGPSSK